MATLSDRPNTALIVIDIQNGVVADAHQRDSVVANIRALVAAAREKAVPWCGCSTPTSSWRGAVSLAVRAGAGAPRIGTVGAQEL